MGWSNYLVIPKWKVLIEISRYIYEIEEYEAKALDSPEVGFPDVGDVNVGKLTLNQLNTLMEAYKVATNIPTQVDAFLLYWLKCLDIEYEVISEFELEKRKELKEFKKLRRW